MKKIWIKGDKFLTLGLKEQEGLTTEELAAYKSEEIEAREARLKEIEKSGDNSKEEIDALKGEIETLKELNFTSMKSAMKSMAEEVAALKSQGIERGDATFESRIKAAWDLNADAIKGLNKGSSIELKATQTYGDIDAGTDFAQMKPGITDKPVRRVLFRSLFGVIPVNTEFLKYTEQETVVRDADNVAKCAAIVSTTKETIKVSTIQTRMIKDMLDFCVQFVEDYAFMASRIRKLITESIALRVDQQILLGTGTGEETFSIDSVSSEFSAANAACVLTGQIQDATMVDLILGMQVQIAALGLEGTYVADSVAVNLCDWFIGAESRKDANGNYLDSRVTYINGLPYIGGMRVYTSPLVVPGTLYVMDSTKGDIVDRGLSDVSISYENKDNWEKEIGSIKAYERLNFLVENNNKDAFMKCSDIALAVTAITK